MNDKDIKRSKIFFLVLAIALIIAIVDTIVGCSFRDENNKLIILKSCVVEEFGNAAEQGG